ncbi:cell division protein [Candidatus Photodesmus katoptron]|uniref:Cell division protein FtsA n=1 Tax=Candidatus Photodesmus katoptron Akat1 TaxID=1236703 RepID=S3DKS3_9GAMM|nr:cell division protein FtsA [Candidatus Photodesmus katoptron]EPE37719.1 cell division protein FtsA [Candidatus Photodesmus katoptron Akat1]KEY90559.1 cell division protein [Candidatus Photodesmus katoptron]
MTRASSDEKIIVALDIGTAAVSALIAEILPDSQINILGAGYTPSKGMKKGGVSDLDLIVKSVQKALEQAELMAGYEISEVFLSLSDKHINSRIEKGMGIVTDQEVSQKDIDRVIYTAKSIKISDEEKILHVIPQEFTLDYQEGIKNPLGLSGVRMEVSVHLISCHTDMAKNIIKVAERCGIKVKQLVYSGLATSNAVITDDEREHGICVVDIGAGTMDLSIWTDGVLRHTEVFSYAGDSVTNDIAFAFGITVNDAEEIKIRHGSAVHASTDKDDIINIPSIGTRTPQILRREMLSSVIEPRYTELMTLVNQVINVVQGKLYKNGLKHHLASGIVLTGGASKIDGLVECAERVFNNQVRVCQPIGVHGLTDCVKEPYHSTVVGLLHYAKNSQIANGIGYSKVNHQSISGFIGRLRNWIKKEF